MGRKRQLATSTLAIVAAILMIVALGKFLLSKPKAKDYSSIAVLPFTNTDNNPDQQYLSDGMAEDIRNDLSRLKGLKVCARASSFQFRGNIADMRDVGEKLNARVLLDGSLEVKEDRIVVRVRLIDAKDGSSIWTEQYSENMDEISTLQGRITSAVAEKLQVGKAGKGVQIRVGRSAPGKEAYALYLKGRSFWNKRTPPDLKKGIDLFRQAIALDSAYAAAYSGVADCYTALGYGSFMAPREAFPRALEAATKALQLDSTLAEPHASLGYYKFYYEWDWAAAEQEFRASIARNANYEIGYDWYGYYLTAMRRYDEARIILKKAKELDPLSVAISTDVGFSYYYGGNYDQAIIELKASLLKNPGFPLAHLWLGRAYQAKKRFPEAISEYNKTLNAAVDWPVALAAIGNVYGANGQKELGRQMLDTLAALSPKKFVTAYGVALVYAGLGEKEQAFAWLDKAFEERSNWLVWLKTDPRWAPISADKRFAELLNRIALPD